MASKRKFGESEDSVQRSQELRRLYASNIKGCVYHDIFKRIPVSESPPNDFSYYPKTSPTMGKDTLYRPLAPFQIRILELKPGQAEDSLSTSLLVVDPLLEGGVVDAQTRQHHSYEAVSHSWGEDQIAGAMYCNDEVVALRKSQYAMLKYLRYRSECRYIWLDTICINQDDNTERAAQIRKMYTIFNHAQRVIIWLGISKSRSAQVFEVIHQMKATNPLRRVGLSRNAARSQTMFIPNMCLDCHTEFELGIDEFSTFPWFRRTWVRQEVFASKAAILRCGPHELSWSDFFHHICDFSRDLTTNTNRAGVSLLAGQLELLGIHDEKSCRHYEDGPTGSLRFVYLLFDQQSSQRPHHDRDLFSVLAGSASFESSDIRDTIYGVLGMTSTRTSLCDDRRPFITIDYSLNALQVFCAATEYFIRRENCLDAMFLAQFNRHPSGKGPSWCPYWPTMNCTPGELRSLCHVNLVQKHSDPAALMFDGYDWPRVIDAEIIDEHRPSIPEEFCIFEDNSIRIEGHVLGAVEAQNRPDGVRELALAVFENSALLTNPHAAKICEGFSRSCSDYTPLRIKYVMHRLRDFVTRIGDHARDETTKRRQRSLDQLCLACVPATTMSGDLFCFLRASSTFVILRPVEPAKDIRRTLFVEIAFASQNIFDMSVLNPAGAPDWVMRNNQTYHQAQADLDTFNRIIRKVSNIGADEEHNPHSKRSAVKKMSLPSTSDDSDVEEATNRPKSRMPQPDTELSQADTELSQADTELAELCPESFIRTTQVVPPTVQRHFYSPIKSVKMTFIIV